MKYGNTQNYSFEERTELLRSTLNTLCSVYRRYKCFIDCNPIEDARLTEGVPSRFEEIGEKYAKVLKIIEKPKKKMGSKFFRFRKKLGMENVTVKSNLYNKFLDVKQLEEIKRLLNQALKGDIEKDILNYQNLPEERRETDNMTDEDVKNTFSLGEISAALWCWEQPQEYWKSYEGARAQKSVSERA